VREREQPLDERQPAVEVALGVRVGVVEPHRLLVLGRGVANLIAMMAELGLFGMKVPEAYGGSGISTQCYALVNEELARGWMSLAGAVGGHSVVSQLIAKFGTEEQKRRYLPRMATGELRATMALTEPSGGSDLQSMRTRAVRRGDRYVVNGSKTWISNAQHSGLFALMVKTDPDAEPRHRGISILLAEPGEGFVVGRKLGKLGYRGVESCELAFDDYEVPADSLLGTEEGQGFVQMMGGLELGRIQVASRAVGVARAALEVATEYARERHAFGRPIYEHQSIGNYIAEMATKLEASRLLVLNAASQVDRGERADLEAGMAKLFASEACMEIALTSMRILGSYGYSIEYPIERYFRDAPLMLIGEGTNEIQRNVIARGVMRRGPAAFRP
jgi:hypothetical protein